MSQTPRNPLLLRTRGMALWDKNSREALFVRKLGANKNASYETYRTYIETRPPEVVAKLAKEAIAVLGQKEVKDALWTAGLKVTAAGPDAMRARMDQYGAIVKKTAANSAKTNGITKRKK